MKCTKCASRMYRSSLNYESNGMNNFSVMNETIFYKCPICGHQHFPEASAKKKVFIAGQKIKGVPVDVN